MPFERRTLLLGAAAALLAGCTRGAPGNAATTTMRAVDLVAWRDFKAAHLSADGRVIDAGNGGISHSEGQGYGMLIAEAAGDRAAFDSIHGWTEATLARPHDALFSWRYAPAEPVPVSDPNNATDGDMLIAWALMRAADRWKEPRYSARAAEIRAAIAAHCIHVQNGRTFLLPGVVGFNDADRTTVNLSYYIWPALDRFRVDGREPIWTKLIRDGEALIDQAKTGTFGLPTDWSNVAIDNRVVPARGKPSRFGFDALRIPLYLMMGGRTAKAGSVAHFWRSCLDRGQQIPAWVDVTTGETAPYPLSPGGYAIVARLLKRGVPQSTVPQDYYSRILSLLTSL